MKRFLCRQCEDFALEKGEVVEMVIRRHWAMDVLLFTRWMFLGILFPLVLYLIFFFLFDQPFFSQQFWLLTWALCIYFIFVTFTGFIRWLNSTLDILFVTDDRVIDITQVDFFHRNIIETRLENVQDATGEVKGFLNTLFDWGSIQIRTANDIADFSIDAVQSPQLGSRKIFSLADAARKKGKITEMNMKHAVKKDEQKQRDKKDLKKKKELATKDAKKLKYFIRNHISKVKIFSK